LAHGKALTDKWEWGSVISRLIVGISVLFLSLLSLGSSKPIIEFSSDGNETDTNSKIWKLAQVDWV
jgi:hypothetical protein